ncbi:MAG: hypothetical protein ACYCRH_02905 [Acidiferrobacteraceae bacterium]
MRLVDKPVAPSQRAAIRSKAIEHSAHSIQHLFDELPDGLVQTPLNGARNGRAIGWIDGFRGDISS